MNTPESVFAADIFCHSTCLMRYIHLSKQSETNMVLLKQNQRCGSFVSFISIEQRWLWVDSY